jgi:hypothetical protein
VAEDAFIRGRWAESAALWRRFGARFGPDLPGRAFSAYSVARCEECLGQRGAAARDYRVAVGIICSRNGDLQGWIASESATRLSAIERSRGLLAASSYWESKARTYRDLYQCE